MKGRAEEEEEVEGEEEGRGLADEEEVPCAVAESKGRVAEEDGFRFLLGLSPVVIAAIVDEGWRDNRAAAAEEEEVEVEVEM